ncbi:MAG TPA: carboxypeptidase regulatory-like domain-containing protein [Candidatus Binatia bacterium]|nr:carboxypeptidase regulatory-like domain-containing protein [Candidatus Binatia bacterium]
MIRLVLVLALALATTGARAEEGAAVKGTITAGPAPGTPVADAVVLVDGPSVPAPPDAPHATIDQRNESFVPHVIAIAVGTTVDFPNHDPVLHNVYAASPAKHFDLGMYGEGESRSVLFDKAGVVRVGCNVHPKMEAFVIVHTNPWAAVTDAHGAYTITGVPPGHYTVRVWHESRGAREVPITLRAGEVLPLDLRLEPAH